MQHPTNAFANLGWSLIRFPECSRELGPENKTLHASALRRIDEGKPGNFPGLDDLKTRRFNNGWENVPISFTWMGMEKADDLLKKFGTKGEAYTPIGSGERSFGLDIEPLVADFGKAVADVAVSRAEERALHVVKERLLTQLCGAWLDGVVERLLLLEQDDAKQAPEHVFAATCHTLGQVRLESLAGIGPALRDALKRDLGRMAERIARERVLNCLQGAPSARQQCKAFEGIMSDKLPYALVLGTLAAVVVEAAQEGGRLERSQLLVHHVVDFIRKYQDAVNDKGKQLSLDRIQSDKREAVRFGLLVAGAGLAWCHANGHCDTNIIRSIVNEPQRYFNEVIDATETELRDVAHYQQLTDRLIGIISTGLMVMSPRKGEDVRVSTRRAADLALDVLGLVLEAECSRRPGVTCKQPGVEIARLRSLIQGVLAEDLQQALLAGGGLLVAAVAAGSIDEARVGGLTRALGGLVAYASTYAHNNPPDAPKLSAEELHRQRVRAIQALADLASERQLRVHEHAFALSVMVGGRAFCDFGISGKGCSFGLQPSLPAGFSYQYLLSKDLAFFIQVPLLDVGQYATLVNGSLVPPSPYSAIVLGGQVGFQVLETTFLLDFRYRPWDQQLSVPDPVVVQNGSMTLGGYIGWHIPLLYLQ